MHTTLTARLATLFCGLIAALSVAAAERSDTADRLAIAEALAQYAYRWDGKDAEGFAQLFTEDALMGRWAAGEIVPASRVEGRQAILDYARAAHGGRLADRQTRHHMSSLVFLELNPREAVTDNMVLITHQTEADKPPYISASGIYRMTWRNTADGWRIASRMLRIDRGAGPSGSR